MSLSNALIKSQKRKMVGMGHQVICSACRLDRLQDDDDNVDNISIFKTEFFLARV